MEKFNYIEAANVTMSDNFHSQMVSAHCLTDVLKTAIAALKDLDGIKKALFYGRDHEVLRGWVHGDIPVEGLHPDKTSAIRLLHGILGVATEAGEMLEALQKGLAGEGFDTTNLFEEIGDNQWYNAAMLRVLQRTFEEVHVVNIAKLRKRFPNKFNEFDANNRDVTAERKLLEEHATNGDLLKPQGKPVVRIRDWMVVGKCLVGTALDHPKAPGGGESDVRTSTILSHDKERNIIETRNTIYHLIGEGGGQSDLIGN